MNQPLSRLSLLLVLGLFSLTSCKKENFESVTVPEAIHDLYYFAEGSYWVYARTDDSLARDTFTVVGRVASEAVPVTLGEEGTVTNVSLGNKREVSLAFPHPSYLEESNLYWGYGGPTADLWTLTVEAAYNRGAVFPATNLDFYTFASTYEIDGDDVSPVSVTVPARTFTNVFKADCSIELPLSDLDALEFPPVIQAIYIEPGLGVVRYDVQTAERDPQSGNVITNTFSYELLTWKLL